MPWCATDGAICLPGLLAFSGRHAWWQEFLLTSEEVRAKPWKRPDFLIRGVFSGQQASHLRDECLRCCYTPPPIQDAQLFSVGRFHLGHPHSTRGAAQFYVCQPPPLLGAVLTPKSHIPPSLLTKLLQTLTLWHTQNAFHGNNLRVCRIRRFCYRLAEANHEVCVLSHTTL